jgi:multidrug efflux pump
VLVVPSIYLLIGGFTKPATYVGEMLDKLRAQTGSVPHGERAPPPHPAE